MHNTLIFFVVGDDAAVRLAQSINVLYELVATKLLHASHVLSPAFSFICLIKLIYLIIVRLTIKNDQSCCPRGWHTRFEEGIRQSWGLHEPHTNCVARVSRLILSANVFRFASYMSRCPTRSPWLPLSAGALVVWSRWNAHPWRPEAVVVLWVSPFIALVGAVGGRQGFSVPC